MHSFIYVWVKLDAGLFVEGLLYVTVAEVKISGSQCK